MNNANNEQATLAGQKRKFSEIKRPKDRLDAILDFLGFEKVDDSVLKLF